MTHLNMQLTVQQRSYYEDELRRIRNGGRCTHEAFLIDKIGGMGSYDLGPVDPPVVGFCNNDDFFYIQYFKNWDEVEALIAQLREEATKAWGPVSGTVEGSAAQCNLATSKANLTVSGNDN